MLSIILILSLGIIVYSNTFNVPFTLDDIPTILGNTSIRDIHNLQNIWNFWPSRFISYFSISLNYHFDQYHLFGYHLFNLGVHLVSAILVWWLALLTFSTPAMKEEKIVRHASAISLFAGLIFVAHPIQTESVTYIVQRATSMAALFYLASLSLYVKSRLLQVNGSSSNLKDYYYIGSVITAILAMFSKEMAITLPLMILLYEFSFFKMKGSLNWRYSAPFFLTLLIIPLATLFTSLAKFQAMRGQPGISAVHYLLTQLRVIVTYIRLVFLPFDQNLDYDYPVFKSIFEIPVLTSFLFLATIAFLAKNLFLKYRLLSFSIFWFFLTLLPESSIFPIQDVIFEHRLYLPMFGYALFLTSFIFYFLIERNNLIIQLLLILIVGWYAVLTYNRNLVWHDEVTLWSDVIKKSPDKARPYFDRSDAYQEKGDLRDAVLDFKKAIAISPDFVSAYANRALFYENQGEFNQAILEYTKSVNVDPGHAIIYFKRGDDYRKIGDFDKAIFDYSKAITVDPNFAFAYNNRGISYLVERKLDQAMSDFAKAIKLDPTIEQVHYNLAVLYYFKADYARAWICIHNAMLSGYKVDPRFLENLKKKSGYDMSALKF